MGIYNIRPPLCILTYRRPTSYSVRRDHLEEFDHDEASQPCQPAGHHHRGQRDPTSRGLGLREAQSDHLQCELPCIRHEELSNASWQESSGLYNFTNIRYAQPPVGDLRFAAPVAPEGRNPEVQDGSGWRQCPQAYPIWSLVAGLYGNAFVAGESESFDYAAAVAQVDEFVKQAGIPAVYAQPNPAVTEDCLFLDVVVPKAVYKSRKAKAPVVVW
jgi:hypothetical protein